jgi:proteasome assembly chaperone (PAC2) family protein
MTALSYQSQPSLRRPFLVAAFEGWSDAGDAATIAVSYLKEKWDAKPLATLDHEEFFDFQAHRPVVRMNEGGVREIIWPSIEFSYASVPGTERDAVLLSGIEPSMRWPTFTKHILDVAHTTGVELLVGFGALLAGRPHTRPTRITGTATTPELNAKFGLQPPRYEGPTGILGVIADACRQDDLDAITLWGWVPHYLRDAPSPTTSLALLQRLSALTDLSIDLNDLDGRAHVHVEQVNEAIENDPDIRATVESLERQADAEDIDDMPSGDDLVAEVERFLRDQRGDR